MQNFVKFAFYLLIITINILNCSTVVNALNKSSDFLFQSPVLIFWNQINQQVQKQDNVSQFCINSLKLLTKGLHENQAWAYQSK